MELGKLVDVQFQTTLRKLASQELPLRAAFTLKGIVNNVNSELKKYDEVRGEALQRLGEKDETGKLIAGDKGNIKLSDDNMKLFVDEMNTLLATPITVGSINAKDLGDKCTLSTSDLLTLDGIIKE